MQEILPEIERWRQEGEEVVVATVVANRRTAPRPVGSSLAIARSGKLCGSVSGGCVENDVVEQAQQVFASGEPKLLVRAAIGWALMGGLYVLLWLVHPAGMGYGDVRLSGILGIVLGYLGVGQLALGAWSAFLLGGLGGVVLVALKVIDRKHNPFGPWMLIGAVLGLVAGPAFTLWMWGDLAA